MPSPSNTSGIALVQAEDAVWLEQRHRQAAVDHHRRTLGDWCPGWAARRSHDVLAPNFLTIDPDTSGGGRGSLLVLCRACIWELANVETSPEVNADPWE